MKIEYSPTYSVLRDCTQDCFDHLAYMLEHDMEKEQLISFVNSVGKNFPCTNSYVFKAFENEQGLKDIYIYSGFVSNILKDIYSGKIKLEAPLIMSSSREKYRCIDITISRVLREHQKKIVISCLKHKRGIVKSPTGSGKSYAIAELVRKFNNDGLKVLITVPTISLLDQLTQDIHDFRNLHGCESLNIGRVGNGSYTFKDVTVGIPNSLSKLDRTKEELELFDVLIADEVHTCANPTYASMVDAMSNRAVSLGLSATPWTSDGTNLLLQAFFGEQVVEIQESEMIQKRIILEPSFEFYQAPAAFVPNKLAEQASNISTLSDGHRYKVLASTYNYVIIKNKARNTMIVNKAIERMQLNIGPVLIIVNKVKGEHSHADILIDLLHHRGYKVPVISGYISKKKKEGLIKDLKESRIPAAVAGPKVLSAGISIPSLSTIILAGAGRSDSDFIQRVGRILRKKEGKGKPLVIDFRDPQFWFASQSKSRLSTAEEIYGLENIIVK